MHIALHHVQVSVFFLFCSVLFCSVLFCSVLFCSVLFCSVLFCSVLFCFLSQFFPFVFFWPLLTTMNPSTAPNPRAPEPPLLTPALRSL